MVKSWRYVMDIAMRSLWLSIKHQTRHPTSFLGWCVMIIIQYISGIWILKVLSIRFETIHGWKFQQLLFLYGLGTISHGVAVIICSNLSMMDSMIIRGQIDRFLLRPLNVPFQLIISQANVTGLLDLITGLVIFSYASELLNFQWRMENCLTLLMATVGACLIRFSIYLSLGAMAFWTKSSSSLFGAATTIMERSTYYPLGILPYFLQVTFTFVIPLGFIAYFPTVTLLGMQGERILPMNPGLITLTFGAVWCVASYQVFQVGLRRYESTGS